MVYGSVDVVRFRVALYGFAKEVGDYRCSQGKDDNNGGVEKILGVVDEANDNETDNSKTDRKPYEERDVHVKVLRENNIGRYPYTYYHPPQRLIHDRAQRRSG